MHENNFAALRLEGERDAPEFIEFARNILMPFQRRVKHQEAAAARAE